MLPDESAFLDKLYHANFLRLRNYALLHVHNPAHAEELVQDTFHEASRKIKDVIGHPHPDAWLTKTLENKIMNYKRAAANEIARFLSLDDKSILVLATTQSAEDTAIDNLEFARTHKEIESLLSKEQLYILRRIVFEKASHLEVAKELHISVWSCQKKLERARNKLDKHFPGHRKKKK